MRSWHRKFCSYGPGGICCSCCRPGSCTKKEARKLLNRKFRRVEARKIRDEARAY